jgi:hypothetical protein
MISTFVETLNAASLQLFLGKGTGNREQGTGNRRSRGSRGSRGGRREEEAGGEISIARVPIAIVPIRNS